jgi:hypothetical protein
VRISGGQFSSSQARASARNVSRSDIILSYLTAWLNFEPSTYETQALIGRQSLP